MKKCLQEFKEFAFKGNVMDLAIGMMIGAAFSKIVSSMVNDILMPIIAAVFRINDFSALKVLLVDKGSEELNVYLKYGQFIQNIIDFLIIAICVFALAKFISGMKKSKQREEVPAEPVKSAELIALEQIVELLKKD